MKTSRLNTALLMATFSGACASPFSEAPLATNFPTTMQAKVQTAGHWNVIAKDVATQITKGYSDNRPLFVREAATKTAFDHAFANQLVSALVEQGRTVSKSATGALVVEIETQSVSFTANRPQYRYIGAATMLAAGIWTLAAVDATTAGVATAAVAGADAHSWFKSEFASGLTPSTEIIVTTSVSDDSRFLMHGTNVYYVADADRSLYETSTSLQTIRVRGGN